MMKGRKTAVIALTLAAMTAVPARAQHLVTPELAAAQVHQATVSAGQDLATVRSFLSEQGADPALALMLDARELADVAGEIRAQQQQQQQRGASTGIYMLAGAGVLLILLLVIGLAVGSSD
jgi:hypothetical protein